MRTLMKGYPMYLPHLAVIFADRTLFLITDQKLSVDPYIRAAIFLLLIAILCFVGRRIPRAFLRRSLYVILSLIAAIICIRTIVIATATLPFAFNLSELNSATKEYESGDYIVVEGVVSKYQVSVDKRQACFLVGNTRICTDMSAGPVGYHRNGTTAPLEEGMHVKVFYHNPIILRIDLLD
jgi:energy-coupling factor transporter transmembrane protein EcfT